jgi:hypothetical protein
VIHQVEILAVRDVADLDDDDDYDHEEALPAFASPTTVTTMQVENNISTESPGSSRQYYHEPFLDSHNAAIASPETYRSQEVGVASFTSPSVMNQTSPESAATPHSHTMAEYAAAHLMALRNTTNSYVPAVTTDTTHLPNSASEVEQIQLDPLFDPVISNVAFDDGIFLPGSTYQELHTTLRNHIFNTARSIAPTRHGSPVNGVDYGSQAAQIHQQGFVTAATNLIERNQLNNISPRVPELTQHEEYELWKNWIDEVAPWVCTERNPQRIKLCQILYSHYVAR